VIRFAEEQGIVSGNRQVQGISQFEVSAINFTSSRSPDRIALLKINSSLRLTGSCCHTHNRLYCGINLFVPATVDQAKIEFDKSESLKAPLCRHQPGRPGENGNHKPLTRHGGRENDLDPIRNP
jgi:hypothetical protein